ncbi:MAG: NAD(P)H-dependent oxidoreductase [Proteobacteria bacterium]|nr:NAD(P)H-dependent oxidoreductase [Pseudomonadota bacterium]
MCESTTLLHVIASPGGEASHSTAATSELLAAYRERHPDHRVHTVNVWDLEMPEFDASMIAAKFAVLRSQHATDAQKAQWARAVAISRAFNDADRFVFSLPMWNYGVPYRLKHYIDIVTLPGQNWSWSRAEGYQPLLRDKRAVLVCSSAGDFSESTVAPGAYEDFQKPFMRQWLRFIGIDVAAEVHVAPTLTDPQRLAQVKQAAAEEARRAAARL